MLRNLVDPLNTELIKNPFLKGIANCSENNAFDKKPKALCEIVIRGAHDNGRTHCAKLKILDCEDMPRLDTSPLLDGTDATPNSPEMPTLEPFQFEDEASKVSGSHFGSNGYSKLNKENVNVTSHVKGKPMLASLANSGLLKRSKCKSKKKAIIQTKPSPEDKRFQPVVMLTRLSDTDMKEVDRDEDSDDDGWSQWPEEYEGCSYDDYFDEGETVEKLPEVDVIDGVEFLSFLQEGDVKDYALKTNRSSIIFPSDSPCANDFDPNLEDMHKDLAIVPTKTRDITQIKGWKRKLFIEDNYASTPNSLSPVYVNEDSVERPYSILDDSSQEPVKLGISSTRSSCAPSPVQHHSSARSSSTPSPVEVHHSSAQSSSVPSPVQADHSSSAQSPVQMHHSSARSSLTPSPAPKLKPSSSQSSRAASPVWVPYNSKNESTPPSTSDNPDPVSDVTDSENVLKRFEEPQLSASSKSAAFASSNLDDFLEKHAKLDVSFLTECYPVIGFIPSNHPVLKVGTLRVEDKEENRSKRKRFAPGSNRYQTGPKTSAKPKIFTDTTERKESALKNDKRNKLEGKSDQRKGETELKSKNKEVLKLPQSIGERNLIFMDEDSNMSTNSLLDVVTSNTYSYDLESSVASPEYSQDSNERRESCFDSSVFKANDFEQEADKQLEYFSIDYYEPMTYDDVTLAESRKDPTTIITETIWSTRDSIKEERMMYDLLCELKSPDAYLISKIKFDDESTPEVNELLTAEDAEEVSKFVYGGCESLQEMVAKWKEVK